MAGHGDPAARAPRRDLGSAVIAMVVTVVLVASAGCGAGGDGTADSSAVAPDTLSHVPVVVERSEGDCGRGDGDTTAVPCVTVQVKYPDITGAPVAALADSVRAFVLSVAAAAPGVSERTEPYPSVDSLVSSFVNQYEEYSREMPTEFPHSWLLERDVVIACNTPSIVSVRADESSYLGGAHGMTVARLASFDPATGRRLGLADWVSDTAAATAAGERAFREQRDITDGQSLARAGFIFFEDGRFSLNDNVMLCDDTLTFHYDPYEIGPYSIGPTDLRLPLSAIGDSTALIRK